MSTVDEPMCLACHLAREYRLVSHTRCGGTATHQGKLTRCSCQACWPEGAPEPTPPPGFGPTDLAFRRAARRRSTGRRVPQLDRRLV